LPDSTVVHHIPTTPSQPYRTKERSLPLIKRKAVEDEFLQLEKSGIVRRSSSPWASAIHVVSKSDGTFRPCGDYRFLNALTIHDAYPMPLITDILLQLNKRRIFSKIDLCKAFHQIPVAEGDIEKTAVITPFGLFEYLRMPFGLRNAAQSFQRHIDHVLRDLDFVRPYLDDILIFSVDEVSHTSHVHTVLDRLNRHNLVINLKKCEFYAREVKFLGHLISENGVSPVPEKLLTISNIPLPKTVTNLRSFLGAVNFYHRFLPNASSRLAVLSTLVTGPKSSHVKWTDAGRASFESAKASLADLVALKFYNPDSSLQLTTDASDFGIGAVLHQITDGLLEPLEFFSRKLNSAQKNYSTFDRELLAIHDAVKHFRNILDGRSFKIFTDHKPLLQLSVLKKPSPRQLRQITFLSEFSFELSHVSGKNNIVADYFSRPDVSAISRTSLFLDSFPSSDFTLSKEDISHFEDRSSIVDNVHYDLSIPGCPRPILPTQLRKEAFDSIHSLHHPGGNTTYDLMHTRFVWPNMRKDIKQWCRECVPCQKNKVTRHIKPPIMRFPTGNRFEVLHLDIVGPLPASNGKTYILTMIDRKTRWPEAVPIASISAENVARHLVATWFSRYGIPDHIITDQGAQFESSLFKALSTSFGFKHVHTTSYHPQANGMIERFHRTLKSSLRCLAITANWTSSLPLVLLGWRNTVHSASGSSPAKLLFGIGSALPNEFFDKNTDIPIESLNLAREHFLNTDTNPSFGPVSSYKPYLPNSLKSSKFIWLQARDTFHMKPRYIGPYETVEFKDNNTVTIMKDNKPYTVNLDKIKPAFGFDDALLSDSDTCSTPHAPTHSQAPAPAFQNESLRASDNPSHVLIQDLPVLDKKTLEIDNSITNKVKKKVTFSRWARMVEPYRPCYMPHRYIRTKE
jgi:transposase InsO family protein